jgi:phenylacetate-CoA ligase
MGDFYDALETRDPEERERALFARLPQAVAHAMMALGWARQLAGVDAPAVGSRAALAALPLLRKSDLPLLQKNDPPFAGFNVISPGKAKRLHMSPGPIFEPQAMRRISAGRRGPFLPRASGPAISCTTRFRII